MKEHLAICLLWIYNNILAMVGSCSENDFRRENAFLFCRNNDTCSLLCRCGYLFPDGNIQANYTCKNGTWDPMISYCKYTSGIERRTLYYIVGSAVCELVIISIIIILKESCRSNSRKSNAPDDTIHIVEMKELDTAYNTDSTRHLTKNEDYQTIDVDGIANTSGAMESYDYEYSSVQKTRSKLDSVEWKNSPPNVSQQITENEIDDDFREETIEVPDTEVSNYRGGIESAHVIQNGSEYTLINKSFKTNK
ncbi:uncharacterized protein LOC144626453 [Crassostrea virginica]